MKKVGIVTITYNGASVIEPFLKDILKQTHSNFVLYIIDNVSTDNTVEVIRNYQDDRIRLILNKDNVGVAGGNNQGIKLALDDQCDYVWILNNDIECEATCLEKLVRVLDEEQPGLVTHKMMYYYDKKLIWYAGSFFNKWNGHVPEHPGLREEDQGQFDHLTEVDYAPTCSILVQKEVFSEIGFMDEKYFAYFDDTDFLYRVYANGKYKMRYLPNIEFYHKVGAATQSKKGTIQKFKFGDFHIKLSTRNKVYYLRKQKSILSKLNIIYFWFWIQLRFVVSGKYNRNFKTWKLINQSFLDGLSL